MIIKRLGVLIAVAYLLTRPLAASAGQAETQFATKDEINLLLTQAKRACYMYENELQLERQLAGAKTMLAADRQVLDGRAPGHWHAARKPRRLQLADGLPIGHRS
jgi:hypothetical protein